jgi:hypothetical protein
MESQCLLPCSQEPAAGPCPKPDESSPLPHRSFLRSILILSSYLRLGFLSGLFPSGFPTKSWHVFLLSHMRATCLTYLTLSKNARNFFYSPVGQLYSSLFMRDRYNLGILRLMLCFVEFTRNKGVKFLDLRK